MKQFLNLSTSLQTYVTFVTEIRLPADTAEDDVKAFLELLGYFEVCKKLNDSRVFDSLSLPINLLISLLCGKVIYSNQILAGLGFRIIGSKLSANSTAARTDCTRRVGINSNDELLILRNIIGLNNATDTVDDALIKIQTFISTPNPNYPELTSPKTTEKLNHAITAFRNAHK